MVTSDQIFAEASDANARGAYTSGTLGPMVEHISGTMTNSTTWSDGRAGYLDNISAATKIMPSGPNIESESPTYKYKRSYGGENTMSLFNLVDWDMIGTWSATQSLHGVDTSKNTQKITNSFTGNDNDVGFVGRNGFTLTNGSLVFDIVAIVTGGAQSASTARMGWQDTQDNAPDNWVYIRSECGSIYIEAGSNGASLGSSNVVLAGAADSVFNNVAIIVANGSATIYSYKLGYDTATIAGIVDTTYYPVVFLDDVSSDATSVVEIASLTFDKI